MFARNYTLGIIILLTLPSLLLFSNVPAQDEAVSSRRLEPEDFQYLGAFRLPDGGERPLTFEYGGSAMTFNPQGDSNGAEDGFPGSLFIMGHDRMPYGELPDGDQVAEVNIPAPTITGDVYSLNQAEFLQGFHEVDENRFTMLDEIPRIGLLYLDIPLLGPRIHITWGQHFQDDPAYQPPSHAWFDPNLDAPNMQGGWFVGDYSLYSVTGYLFEIPADWAGQYSQGQLVATGRFRDGGWSGMGPSLIAYHPCPDGCPQTEPPAARLPATALLLYENSTVTETFEHALTGYQHPDEWEGGAWITTSTGKTGVLFAGTKSTGDKYWYGFVNPQGAEYPCVEGEMVGQFPICRLADGALCPSADLVECEGHTSGRGWWATRFDAQFILYDPADFARVATGQMQTWEPQPYAVMDIDDHLFLNPDGIDLDVLGAGDQRHSRIGEVGYDRQHGLLYVLELFAEDAKPVVHVWRVE
ncbi:MAG: hypothetical protein DWB42_16380 [Chloroflexi bacterium]|nr:hypothetical protein [Chloroflexota bacterium]